jgi:hypothetical protein
MRIIGADEKPEIITLNQRVTDEEGVEKILNDVSVGRYDVVMDTGPGFATKRGEAVEAMMTLLAADPTLMQTAGDLIFRNMDFPGAEIIADRMAASNPLAQIDEKSDIPPQVQMQLAQSKKMLEDMQAKNQELAMNLQYGQSVVEAKERGATARTLMQATAKAHDSELKSESIVNQVNMKAITSQNKTEIDAIVKMLIANLDTSSLKAEMDRRNAEQMAFAEKAVSDIDQEQNPLMDQQQMQQSMQQPQQPMEQAPMQPQPPMQGM